MEYPSFDSFKNGITNVRSSQITMPSNVEAKKHTLNVDNQNIKPLENDKVELSKDVDKKSKVKKGFLIGGGIALALASVAGIVHIKNVSKAKKTITEAYDKIFDMMHEQLKKDIGIDFVKPKLKFTNIKGSRGGYIKGEGVIEINKKMLNRKNFALLEGNKVIPEELEDGTMIVHTLFDCSRFKKIPSECRRATQEEYLLEMASLMRHELTHAQQEQMILHSKGGLDKLYQAFKKAGKIESDLSFEDFKKLNPFYRDFKSDNIDILAVLVTTPFSDKETGKGLRIEYSVGDLIKSIAGYTAKDKVGYYKNLLEIEARNNEADVVHYINEIFPDIDFSKEAIHRHAVIKQSNLASLFFDGYAHIK